MESYPYQTYAMDDSRYPFWMADQDNYMQPCRQQAMPFFNGEEICFDDFSNGSTSAQPMQRFMDDEGPYPDVIMYGNIPLSSQHKWQTQQQFYQADFRQPSPDRTSSSNTSQDTPDELSSPYTYYDTPFVSPMDCSQMSYSFPTEQFQGIPCPFETTILPRNCSLSDVEYNCGMPEMIENDDVIVKQEPTADSMHGVVKKEETPELMVYSDSSIANSTRDAQSVEPVDLPEEHSSDSEYSPSCRSGKRRKSTASSGQTAKRRRHVRKDSQASSTTGSAKVEKKARRTSKTSYHRNSEPTHRADCPRLFPCPFASYGCKSDFSSKNEWKRHISTQHIKLSYWRCDLCPPSVDPNDEESFYHNDFNRKDLFTQHLRRMHAAPKDKEKGSHNHKEYPVNDDNLAEHQVRCSHRLRIAPQFSSCLFCPRSFEGATSWDERIEHVGRHLEKDQATIPDMLDPRTWFVDERLEVYLVEEGLIARDGCGWRIGDGNPCRGSGVVDSEDEE